MSLPLFNSVKKDVLPVKGWLFCRTAALIFAFVHPLTL